jgi:hypothetical protein
LQELSQLQQNRRVVQDFTATTLSRIPDCFGRLVYIASLRDLSSGRYEHAGLSSVYPEESVQQALALCHEQIFEKVLEMPLARQEADLRGCLQRMESGFVLAVEYWHSLESYRILVPQTAPDYLKELFYSNLRVLLEILRGELAKAR